MGVITFTVSPRPTLPCSFHPHEYSACRGFSRSSDVDAEAEGEAKVEDVAVDDNDHDNCFVTWRMRRRCSAPEDSDDIVTLLPQSS